MSIINAIWKLKKVVTITPNNYNELKKVTDLVDGFIKNKQAVLSKKQNKIFNQQKNEIKRFEDSLEAVPAETTADVLPFQYKKSFKQEIDEMSKPAPTVGGKTIEEALGGISWADKKKKAKRIKQGLSTKIKLNTPPQNRELIKEFIGGKNDEFNWLNKEQRKEVLNILDDQMKKSDFASGGRFGKSDGWPFGWELDTRSSTCTGSPDPEARSIRPIFA